jgi:hypothetical protein
MHDPGDEAPAPPAPAPDPLRLCGALRRFADGLASAYGGPIYLVGSGVDRIHLWPGDYGYHHDLDLRCLVPRAQLELLFGPRAIRNDNPAGHCHQDIAQMREQLKQSRRLSRALQMRVDFQIQTVPVRTRYAHLPRLRVDTLPDELFTAGLGEP